MSRNDVLVLGLWCAAILALLSPIWAAFGTSFFNHGDLYTYHAPLRSLTASALQSGHIPFWNPYILLGVPHLANSQAAAFYPPSLLGAFFPIVTALVWDQIFHLLWAGAGMFLLSRAQGLERFGAAVLACAFALSPFLVYRVTAGIPTLLAALAWIPWLWLAWLSGSWILLSAMFALQFLSGHAQFLLINVVAMGIWALCGDGRRVLISRLAGAGGAALALTCVQWPLTAQFLRASVRSNWSGAMSNAYAMPIDALKTWLSPAAFGTPLGGTWSDVPSVFYETCGGWISPAALAFAAYGLVQGKRRIPIVVLAAIGIFLAVGPKGLFSREILGFAVLSYVRTPSRWLLLGLWACLISAGVGVKRLCSHRLPRGARLLAVLTTIVPLAAWDVQFLRPQNPAPYLAAHLEVSEVLAGRPERVLTDPVLANPNKAMLYRMMNVNGYEAFYLKGVPGWATSVEGVLAADASRVYVSRWRSPAAIRAGVAARLSANGIKQGPAWPLAAFIDAHARRVLPDPRLWIEREDRWKVWGVAPPGAVALALSFPLYPGWRARLGSGVVSLVPGDGLFSAFILPRTFSRGAHFEMRLEFIPTAWAWFLVLTIASWIGWGALLARRSGVV